MSHAIAVPVSEVGYLDLRQDTDPLMLAFYGFLAAYKGGTRKDYEHDLKIYLEWCASIGLAPLAAKRGHLESYVRWMETQRDPRTGRLWASSTICRRYDTIRGFYRAADRDELLPGKDPATWVKRPKVDHDSQRRTYLNALEFGQFMAQAEIAGPIPFALASLLGLNALRISEACSLNIEEMTVDQGYDVINFIGKGGKWFAAPLSVPVMRAVRAVVGDRTEGPVLLNQWGNRMTRANADRIIKQIARDAKVNSDISPHSLRRTYVTTASAVGISMRDVQITLRHKHLNTTMIYDRGTGSHDRNSTHRLSSFVFGIVG